MQTSYDLPHDEIMEPGHQGCSGCGVALAMRLALKALSANTVFVIPAGCCSVIDGPWPQSASGVPVMHTPSASAAAAAAGVRAALDYKGDTDTTVCCWAGAGGSFERGLQALSASAERNENILHVCYDIEADGEPVVQSGPAGPFGVPSAEATAARWSRPRKDLVLMMAAHRIPYIATATVAYPDDLVTKVERARAIRGTRFLHLLTPCPPAWGIAPKDGIDYARRAVATHAFPLIEVEHGETWRVTVRPDEQPLGRYLDGQERFRVLVDDEDALAAAQREVERRWHLILERAESNTWAAGK